MLRKQLSWLCVLIVCGSFVGCGGDTDTPDSSTTTPTPDNSPTPSTPESPPEVSEPNLPNHPFTPDEAPAVAEPGFEAPVNEGG